MMPYPLLQAPGHAVRFALAIQVFLALLLLIVPRASAEGAAAPGILVDFSREPLPDFVRFNNTTVAGKASEQGLDVRFEPADWPNVFFQAPAGGWDWSGHAGVGITLVNPGDVSVDVALRLDNEGADGSRFCNTLQGSVKPGSRFEFKMRFSRTDGPVLWGMRGMPGDIPCGRGDPLNLKAITAFQLFLARPEHPCVLRLESMYLFGSAADPFTPVPLPFVDRFGQYKHAEWPGKLASEADFEPRIREEGQALSAEPALPERDRFGGWKDGPRLEATGWFRAERVDGKWWLVTPDGTLFFSLGIDCVGTGEQTFIEKREPWFDWLPSRDDPLFGGILGKAQGAHSMAEPVGGSGSIFSFYTANLVRKYGDGWRDTWRDRTYQRLRHWGFNTVGNWSQGDVMDGSPIPFTACAHIAGVRRIETATGYWGKMIDVYDGSFEKNVEPAIAAITEKYAGNPLCIGYFADNELAWEGIVNGVLASGPEQPARQALIKFLTVRYGSVEALNRGWETAFESWEALSSPEKRSARVKEDLDAYLFSFSLRYFSVIKDAFKRHAPNQLYLGCRFSTAPDAAVRACAEAADVVSFNLYYRYVPADGWTGDKALGKPILIGEFHFGALDRGMFHTGLVSADDQAARAAAYATYVRSVLTHPAFVGCHWFQYVDEPVTGRWYDGENYNIGFLDVTDTPYPELVRAAREIHRQAYPLRYGTATASR